MRRFAFTIVVGLAAIAALPATASAAGPTCVFDTAVDHDATVALDATAESSKLTIQVSGGNIQFLGASGTQFNCAPGTPTVTNTSRIVVNDLAGHDTTINVNEQNGAFVPGFNTPPDTGAPEIDIALNLLDGNDTLQVDGTDNADNWLFGQSATGDLGANLNNTETVPDATDLTASGVDLVTINGRKGDDTISLAGTTALVQIAQPLVRDGKLTLDGGNQNDTLRGGSGIDLIEGGTQDDDLDGGGGNDNILGQGDNDSLADNNGADTEDGGDGTDLMTYANRTNPLNVTADGTPNDGGAEDSFADNVTATVENINGGAGDDILTGNALVNSITGNAGNDTVSGGDADDKVSGSDGLDRLLGQNGNDNIFGGPGNDNQVGGANNDKITGNSGKDIFLGKKGIDRLLAKDNTKDKKLNCGKGKNKLESFIKDRVDPKPKSC